MVDYPIDTTLLVTKGDLASLHLASIIYESNKKYAAEGQFGVILNQLKKGCETKDIENANSFSLNTLGVIKEYDDKIDEENIKEILKKFIFKAQSAPKCRILKEIYKLWQKLWTAKACH